MQPPNKADRADIFLIHTRNMPCSPDVNLKELARLTAGYTGADIKLVCREAAVAALDVCYSFFATLVTWPYQKFADKLHFSEQESFDLEEVATRHFKPAISSVKPSDVEFYQKLAKDFRRYVDGGAPTRKQYSRRWLGLKRSCRNLL